MSSCTPIDDSLNSLPSDLAEFLAEASEERQKIADEVERNAAHAHNQNNIPEAAASSSSSSTSFPATLPANDAALHVPRFNKTLRRFHMDEFDDFDNKKKKIGEGSFGVAYEVRLKNSNQLAVIKQLRLKNVHRQPQDHEKTVAELETFFKIEDDVGVLQLLGVVVDERVGGCAIVMEHMNLGTLRDYLRANPGLTLRQRLDICLQCTCAIQHMHSKGMLHADIKPDNFLVSSSLPGLPPKVKISDFGLAVLCEQSAACRGSASYQAPEVLLRKEANSKPADIYSLGILMRTICHSDPSTRKIYPNLKTVELLRSAMEQSVLELRPVIDHFLPVELKSLIQQAWHMDPSKRPSADEIVDALKKILEQVTVPMDSVIKQLNQINEASVGVNVLFPLLEFINVVSQKLSTFPNVGIASDDVSNLLKTVEDMTRRVCVVRDQWKLCPLLIDRSASTLLRELSQPMYDAIVSVIPKLKNEENLQQLFKKYTDDDKLRHIRKKLHLIDNSLILCESLRRYTRSTRQTFADKFRDFVFISSPAAAVSQLFWLRGPPGSGKTTISAMLCQQFSDAIVAVHFCKHNAEPTRSPLKLIYSIAAQMSARIREYRDALYDLIVTKGIEITTDETQCSHMWEQLILTPLANINKEDGPSELHEIYSNRPLACHASRPESPSRRRFIILIDALDESVHNGSNALLDLLSSELHRLPRWLAIYVSSRPESSILTSLVKFKPVCIECEDKNNQEDVRLYLEQHLMNLMQEQQHGLRLQEAVEHLLKMSGGLFLYCDKVIEDLREAKEHSLQANTVSAVTLADVKSFPSGLTGYYQNSMESITALIERDELERVKMASTWIGMQAAAIEIRPAPSEHQMLRYSIVDLMKLLKLIVVSLEPLSLQQLAHFSGIPVGQSMQLLKYFHSFLAFTNQSSELDSISLVAPSSVTPSGPSVVTSSTRVEVFHKSFADWLTNTDRLLAPKSIMERIFYVDAIQTHDWLATQCFSSLLREPTEDHQAILTRLAANQTRLPICDQLPTPPLLCVEEIHGILHRSITFQEYPSCFNFQITAHPEHDLTWSSSDSLTSCFGETQSEAQKSCFVCKDLAHTSSHLNVYICSECRIWLCEQCFLSKGGLDPEHIHNLDRWKFNLPSFKQTVRYYSIRYGSTHACSALLDGSRIGSNSGTLSLSRFLGYMAHPQYVHLRTMVNQKQSLIDELLRTQNIDWSAFSKQPLSAAVSSLDWIRCDSRGHPSQCMLEQVASLITGLRERDEVHFSDLIYQYAAAFPSSTVVSQIASYFLPWFLEWKDRDHGLVSWRTKPLAPTSSVQVARFVESIDSMFISKDGKRIHICTTTVVFIYDILSRSTIHTLRRSDCDESCSWDAVAFHPVSRSFVTTAIATSALAEPLGDGTGWTILCIDMLTGELQAQYAGVSTSNDDKIDALSYSPTGSKLVACSRTNKICMWDADTGCLVWKFQYKHTDSKVFLKRLSFSPDESCLGFVHLGFCAGVWNVASKSQSWQDDDAPSSLAFSVNCQVIATARFEAGVRFCDLKSRTDLTQSIGLKTVLRMQFHPQNHEIIAVVGHYDCQFVHVIHHPSGMVLQSLAHGADVLSLHWLANGRQLFTSSKDMIREWDMLAILQQASRFASPIVSDSSQKELNPPTGKISCARFDCTGKRVASGTTTGHIRVWNVDSGDLILETCGGSRVSALAWNKSDVLASLFLDNVVRLWDGSSGALIRTFDTYLLPKMPLFSRDSVMEWSLNGTRLAFGLDECLKLVNGRDYGQIRMLSESKAIIGGLSFAHDSSKLMSCCYDGSINIWSADNGSFLQIVRRCGEFCDARFDTESSHRLVVAQRRNWMHKLELLATGGHKLIETRRFQRQKFNHSNRTDLVQISPNAAVAWISDDLGTQFYDCRDGSLLCYVSLGTNLRDSSQASWSDDSLQLIVYNPTSSTLIVLQLHHVLAKNQELGATNRRPLNFHCDVELRHGAVETFELVC